MLQLSSQRQSVDFFLFLLLSQIPRKYRIQLTGSSRLSLTPLQQHLNAFKDASASFFDTPAFSAIAATKSALFMIKFLLWIFIIYIIRAVFPNYLQEYIYLFLWGLSRKMRYFLGFYVLLPFLKPYFELNKEVNVER